MKKKSLVVLIAAFALFSLTACATKEPEVASTPEPVAESGVIAEGRLLPVNWLEQSFTLAGKVSEVNVADGDVVETGDVLARLEASPEAELALARAEEEVLAAQLALDELQASAELNLAQAELAVINAQQAYDTAQSVFDGNTSDENKAERDSASAALALAQDAFTGIENGDGIDPDLLAAAQARLATANAAVANAQALVAAQELTASIEGTVVDISLQPNQVVGAGAPVMVVADLTAWVVKTDNLSETQIAAVAVGDPVEVTLDALPDLKLTGEVTHINARYEEKRGDITFTVTVQVNEVDPRMRWGMTSAVYFKP